MMDLPVSEESDWTGFYMRISVDVRARVSSVGGRGHTMTGKFQDYNRLVGQIIILYYKCVSLFKPASHFERAHGYFCQG